MRGRQAVIIKYVFMIIQLEGDIEKRERIILCLLVQKINPWAWPHLFT